MVQQKSSYELQAQVSAFATEGEISPWISNHLLNNIGRLASIPSVEQLVPAVYTTDTLEALIRYTEYLKQVGGRKHESIRFMHELLANFETFGPTVDGLLDQDAQFNKDHRPDYLDSGLHSDAFVFEQEGQEYVVCLPISKILPATLDKRLKASLLTRDIPHFEKIVAASYENGAVISERMPGTQLQQVSTEALQQATIQQLEELLATLSIAGQKGIVIDIAPKNIFYDTQEGFGFIDTTARSRPSSIAQVKSKAIVLESIKNFVHVLTDPAHKNGQLSFSEEAVANLQARLDLARQMRDICELLYGTGEEDRFIRSLDNIIKGAAGTLEYQRETLRLTS
jgi:hypothetical protein